MYNKEYITGSMSADLGKNYKVKNKGAVRLEIINALIGSSYFNIILKLNEEPRWFQETN